MQKCIEVVDLSLLSKILKVVVENYKKLSLHAYGCRVIQKYLEKLHEDVIYKDELLMKCLDKTEKENLGS